MHDPGAAVGDLTPFQLLWTPRGDRVGLISASSARGYTLVSELLDRSYCEAGAFDHASIWRPGTCTASSTPRRRGETTRAGSTRWLSPGRLDAIYRTSIRGTPAWYLDQYSTRGAKELNFHTGPFIFAFSSYVFDDDPLLMDDLLERASALPLLGGW